MITPEAMKHYMISASAGYSYSLEPIKAGYRMGLVDKDDFEKTLRSYSEAQCELKSEWRDKNEAVKSRSALH